MPNADLPSSPAARAFFAALDTEKTSGSAGASSFVQKRIQTLGWRNRFSQQDFYPVTVDGVEFLVRQVQRGEVDGTYGTGATVWPAAIVLMKYLEKHAENLIRNKRCVDLGSGTGITSIAAALLGAKEVVCTDGEPNVVKLAVDNLERVLKGFVKDASVDAENTSDTEKKIRGCPLSVQEYWWGSGSIQGGNHADVVLAADCVLPKLYPIGPLVDAIDELLKSPRAVAILSYEYRYYPDFDPGQEFRRLCDIKGLSVESIALSEHDSVYSVEDIEIWHVRRST
eukprot:scaffold768_cov166-Amphora_coffeaeformis.AAC.20